LLDVFAESLSAVHGGHAVLSAVEANAGGGITIGGRTVPAGVGFWVAALGKAAGAMAEAFAEIAGERVRDGLVITRDGYGKPLPQRFSLRFGGHPVPDSRGEKAARELIEWVARIPEDDVLVVLLSGGASALASLPEPGLELSDLVEANRLLLASGADIHAMNAIRKHCSQIAGGRLALAASCKRIEVLALSDVPGDTLSTIGSGPCVGDPTTFADALGVAEHFGLSAELPEALRMHLEAGSRGETRESPNPDDPALAGVTAAVVANNAVARLAALRAASDRGQRALDLGEILTGEAREAGRRLAALARSVQSDEPILLIAGGETVVTLKGGGRGGRSQELALAAVLEWESGGMGRAVALLAVGTDGADGPTDAAGAIVDASSRPRGTTSVERAWERLHDNDSYGFFEGIGDLVRTGPTDTNVMDLVFIRIGASKTV
jgi:glycerate 2-kinase